MRRISSVWKQQKWLAPHTPPDVQRYAAQFKDPEGYYAVWRATLSVMGYNTNLVPAKDAPTGYLDLLDPKWKGKLVKSHPGYSGTSLTGTYAIVKALGWDYLEKLSKQGVQQLQSTTATPKSIASGERAVMVDGNEYNMFIEIDAKSPVAIIYPKEGTPFVTSPTAIFADAPHPNAARVLQNFLHRQDPATGGQRGRHAFAPSRCQGSARANAADADQDAARRSGGHAAAGGGHQEALHGAVRQLTAAADGGNRKRIAMREPSARHGRGSIDWTAPFSIVAGAAARGTGAAADVPAADDEPHRRRPAASRWSTIASSSSTRRS